MSNCTTPAEKSVRYRTNARLQFQGCALCPKSTAPYNSTKFVFLNVDHFKTMAQFKSNLICRSFAQSLYAIRCFAWKVVPSFLLCRVQFFLYCWWCNHSGSKISNIACAWNDSAHPLYWNALLILLHWQWLYNVQIFSISHAKDIKVWYFFLTLLINEIFSRVGRKESINCKPFKLNWAREHIFYWLWRKSSLACRVKNHNFFGLHT